MSHFGRVACIRCSQKASCPIFEIGGSARVDITHLLEIQKSTSDLWRALLARCLETNVQVVIDLGATIEYSGQEDAPFITNNVGPELIRSIRNMSDIGVVELDLNQLNQAPRPEPNP